MDYEHDTISKPTDSSTARTILIVEDEDEVRKVLRLTLQLQGYAVLAAPTAAAALELDLTGAAIDLLLTDVVLPESSGPELARALRSSIPELKVIYMSGYSEELLQTHGLSSYDAAFLAKPFSSVELGKKVQQLLG